MLQLCREKLCAKSTQGTFGVLGHRKTKGARTWHLVNLPEQDAELVTFLWFKNNKTLAVSCVLSPFRSRCLNLYIFCKSRRFNSSRQIRTMRHMSPRDVSDVTHPNILTSYKMWTSTKNQTTVQSHDVRAASHMSHGMESCTKPPPAPPGGP